MVLVTEMVTGGMWEGPVQSASTPGEMERVKSSQILKSQAPIREVFFCWLRLTNLQHWKQDPTSGWNTPRNIQDAAYFGIMSWNFHTDIFSCSRWSQSIKDMSLDQASELLDAISALMEAYPRLAQDEPDKSLTESDAQ